jgi:predicted nucleic acid-binding protein
VARIVLDTDVVSRHRAGRLPPELAHQVASNDISIAFATAGELWKGALAARWGGARRGGLDLWLEQALILDANLRVARIWGEITSEALRRGRPRPANDTWIAACCIEAGVPLLTLNRRDFTDFAAHDGLVLLAG